LQQQKQAAAHSEREHKLQLLAAQTELAAAQQQATAAADTTSKLTTAQMTALLENSTQLLREQKQRLDTAIVSATRGGSIALANAHRAHCEALERHNGQLQALELGYNAAVENVRQQYEHTLQEQATGMQTLKQQLHSSRTHKAQHVKVSTTNSPMYDVSLYSGVVMLGRVCIPLLV
jgi:acyl-CoA reductase-like NAD-dependent aldehyde dehydrogenase